MDSKQRDRLIDILNLGESNLVKADMIQEFLSQLEQEAYIRGQEETLEAIFKDFLSKEAEMGGKE